MIKNIKNIKDIFKILPFKEEKEEVITFDKVLAYDKFANIDVWDPVISINSKTFDNIFLIKKTAIALYFLAYDNNASGLEDIEILKISRYKVEIEDENS